jgi:peptidoglycan-associated lipoprotein
LSDRFTAHDAFAFAAIALTVGCGKKPVVTTTPPSQPAPQRVRRSLIGRPASINKGDTVTLSWTSTNATQVTIFSEVGAVAPESSTKVKPADSTTYSITASGPAAPPTPPFASLLPLRRLQRQNTTLRSTKCS